MRALALALLLTDCGGSSVPATGPCSVAERTLIGAEYQLELVADCAHDSGCPHFDEITKRRDQRRMEWVKCSPP